MRRLFFIFVFLATLPWGISTTHAQLTDDTVEISRQDVDYWAQRSIKTAEQYADIVSTIRVDRRNLDSQMRRLRAYYPYTRDYTPFSKHLIDQMTRYAYTVDTSQDQATANEALHQYRTLVYKHIANLDVVSYALKLSRLDVRFGDEQFLALVEEAIHNSWKGMHNAGLEPDDAYNIVTYGEESYILSTYGGTIEKSDIYKVGRTYYDVRDITTEDGNSLQIFFNVTTPIRITHTIRAVREKEAKKYIPLQ